MASFKRRVIFPLALVSSTFIGVVIMDQATKAWLPAHVLNRGISFGVAAGWGSLPLASAVLMLALTVGLFVSAKRNFWPWWGWLGIGGILGGGLSNILDRLFIGAVRDPLVVPFTNLHNNIADYAIFCGVTLVIFAIHWRDKQEKSKQND